MLPKATRKAHRNERCGGWLKKTGKLQCHGTWYIYLFELRERINNQIRAKELRVVGSSGENVGILTLEEALKKAYAEGLDLIEISPNANPPVAKIMEYGKYQYEKSKKQKKAKAGAKTTETKSIQVKVGTGDHDLGLKAKHASEWLKEGHRVKVELFLHGRSKYMDKNFLKDRIDRVLHLITSPYKIAEEFKKGPKGYIMVIEKV